MIRILHVISSSGVFGAERVIINLVEALPDTEFQLAVFRKPNGGHAALASKLKKLDVVIHLLDDSISAIASAVSRLRRVVVENDISAVHAHGYKGNVVAAAALAGVKSKSLICTEHGFTDTSLKSRIYGALDRVALRAPSVNRVICVSDELKERCIAAGVPARKIQKIKNAVPRRVLSQSEASISRDIDILYLGRLSREKGPHILIDALAGLNHRDLRIVFAGDGPDAAALKRQAHALGLGGNIEFSGYCDAPDTLLRRAKWFVLPSLTEGLPLALLEAFAVGTPAIASEVGEIGALYRDADWGYLVDAGDVDGLQSALAAAMALPVAQWRAHHEASKRLIERDFSFAAWVSAWEGQYAAAAGKEQVS